MTPVPANAATVDVGRVDGWVSHRSDDMRSCYLLGHRCVASFDIVADRVAELSDKIVAALVEPTQAMFRGECDAIYIWLYDDGVSALPGRWT